MKFAALVCAVLIPVACCAAGPDAGILETANTARDVVLENGVALRMAARSTGAIYADHAVLQQGAARVSNFAGYRIEAGQLLIESEAPGTAAVIRMNEKTVEIASLGGALKVTDGGAMLTRVAAGSKMAFQNSGASAGQTGAAPAPKTRSETKTFVWVIVAISAAALAIGLTAAAQGKSPF